MSNPLHILFIRPIFISYVSRIETSLYTNTSTSGYPNYTKSTDTSHLTFSTDMIWTPSDNPKILPYLNPSEYPTEKTSSIYLSNPGLK